MIEFVITPNGFNRIELQISPWSRSNVALVEPQAGQGRLTTRLNIQMVCPESEFEKLYKK